MVYTLIHCRVKKVKPNYIGIEINGRKPQGKRTTNNAITYRINQEIKFLYCKKHNINQRIYRMHLEGAQQFDGMWQYIENYIDTQKSFTLTSVRYR